jgi:O-antigen/teichoic acid export membrane protein
MRRFLADVSLVLCSHGLRLAGLVACQAIIVRSIGQDGLGHFSFWIAVLALVGVVSDLGLGPTVAREIAKARNPDEENALTAAMCRELAAPLAVYAIVILLCTVASCLLISPDLLAPGIIAGCLGWGFALQIPLRDLLAGKRDLLGFAALNACPLVLGCVGIVLLKICSLLTVATAVGCIAFGHSFCCVWLLLRSGATTRPERAIRLRFQQARRQYGWRVSLGRMAGTAAFLLDMPILGFYWPTAHLATYAAIKTFTNPFAVAGNVVSRVVFKKLVSARQIPPKYAALMGGYALLAGVCALCIVSPAMELIYGINSAPYRVAIVAQCIAVMLHIAYTLYDTNLLAQGRGRALSVGGIGFGVICVVTNLVLIRWRGVEGACIANLICNSVWLAYCVVCTYVIKPAMPLGTKQSFTVNHADVSDGPGQVAA